MKPIISVFEARAALQRVSFEVQSSEGEDALRVLQRFLAQYKTIK